MILSIIVFSVFLNCFYHGVLSAKSPIPYNQTIPSAKFDNPNYVRDRYRLGPYESKPAMPSAWLDRQRKPFTPAWMDYCDPYHCNDYHKLACGLHRASMRFKWFQSTCHLILNNMCYYHRGLTRYDLVDSQYCQQHVLQVRSGCPAHCALEPPAPVCAVSRWNEVVLFRSQCDLDRANCGFLIQPFEEAIMEVCEYFWDVAFSQ